MKHLSKISISLILLCHISCQKEILQNDPIQESGEQTAPVITTTTLEQAGDKLIQLSQHFGVDTHFKPTKDQAGIYQREASDFAVRTDVVKTITQGDYTSYTMYVETTKTADSTFYNLTIEDKNGEERLFVTKYTPTETWLENKTQAFSGSIVTRRATILENPHENGTDLNAGGSFDPFVDHCNGTVTETTIFVPYACTCEGHMPGEYCICSNPPGYNSETVYECIENDPTDPNAGSDGNSLSNGSGNAGDPNQDTGPYSDEEQEAMTALVTEDEVKLEDCLSMNASINNFYSEKSPFNVDLSEVRLPCKEENIDTTLVATNEKFMCIYNKLIQSPKFKNLFIDMFGESENMNVTFKIIDNLTLDGEPVNGRARVTSGQRNASTGEILNINIDIALNKNLFGGAGARTPMQIAKTIIHECVHAFLMVKSLDCDAGSELDEFNNTMLFDLLNYYYNFNNSCVEAPSQHDFMFDYMLPTMTDILSEVKDSMIPENQQQSIEGIDFYNLSQVINGPLTESTPFNWNDLYFYTCLIGLQEASSYQTAASANPLMVFLRDSYHAELTNLSKNCYD